MSAATSAARSAWLDRRFRDGIESLRQLLRVANRYVDHAAPWSRAHDDPAAADRAIATCFALQRTLASAITPVLPTTAARIQASLALTPEEIDAPLDVQVAGSRLDGRTFHPGPPLFERIDPQALELETGSPG